MGVVVDGGEQYAALARALKRAGEDGLRKVLDDGFRTPLQELMPALKASQFHVMPKRGGAAAAIGGRTFFTTRAVVKGAAPGVRLVARQRGRIQRQDRGILRRPVFADSDKPRDEWEWINQRIEAGWFSDVVKAAQPDIRRRTERALDDVARQVDVDVSRAKGR